MMCEMCGKDEAEIRISIEGSELSVCKKCQGFGKTISAIAVPFASNQLARKAYPQTSILQPEGNEIIEVIVADYSRIIKAARERTGLKQNELAQKIAEKESVIHKLESGHHEPSIGLARKLEKFLGVMLIESHEENSKLANHRAEAKEVTLGDIVKIRKK